MTIYCHGLGHKGGHMVCIYCASDTQIINSRHQKRRNHVWRRRKCVACKAIFTTTEQIELQQSLSIRSNGRLSPFLRERLLISIYDSLKHRPTASSDAAALTETILNQLQPLIMEAALNRNDLVVITSETLQRFDTAAATYYSAYHPITSARSSG
jgi:transcriptional regulator NrdR family protein